jgi:hypothetical protein
MTGNRYHGLISHQLVRDGCSAFSRTAIIFSNQLKLKTIKFARICDGNTATLRDIDTETGVATGHRSAHANLDRLSGCDHSASIGITGAFRRCAVGCRCTF